MIALTDILDWTNGEKGTVLVFALSMSYLNIIVNPLIYASRIQRIRRFIRRIFKLPAQSSFISEYRLKP
jgi:hypothetical protein